MVSTNWLVEGGDAMTAPPVGRREALVFAGMDCIAEKGFEGLRLRDVAARAGIDHSTLHYYFATKQDLVAAVVDHVVQQFVPTMPGTGEPTQRLHRHLIALAGMMGEQPTLFAVMSELDQRAHHDPGIRGTLLGYERGWRGVLAELFREGRWSLALEVDAAVELVIAVAKGVSRNPQVASAVFGQLEALLRDRPSRAPRRAGLPRCD